MELHRFQGPMDVKRKLEEKGCEAYSVYVLSPIHQIQTTLCESQGEGKTAVDVESDKSEDSGVAGNL
ncbi:Hypothetical predicted protein [Octopus vulgaris]|uniref:Uncharacterized protein n=1 Tax=Octopus vulgaris TaxID=6645 RepID=A0AA36EXL2_OCTVU|nr:Hypothetical predicted protein [Octopus vulgaris]